ncbi:hypothetical protein MD484_g8555, partial [Candolleomyces efflorescens]
MTHARRSVPSHIRYRYRARYRLLTQTRYRNRYQDRKRWRASGIVRRLLGGGASVRKIITWDDLRPYAESGQEALGQGRYELHKYASLDDVPSILRDVDRSFTLPVPISALGQFLNVAELKAIARVHQVHVNREDTKGRLLAKFEGHHCPACDQFMPVFVRIDIPADPSFDTFRKEYMDSLVPSVKPLGVGELLPFSNVAEGDRHLFDHGAFTCGARLSSLEEINGEGDVPASGPNYLVCAPVPWLALSRNGTKAVVSMVARLHGLALSNRTPKAVALEQLRNHGCVDCRRFYAVFVPVVPKPRMARRTVARAPVECGDENFVEADEEALAARHSPNAIQFPSPTVKIYQKLPPGREELDEVIAFIFTGIKPPTEEDLGRTPMLVLIWYWTKKP